MAAPMGQHLLRSRTARVVGVCLLQLGLLAAAVAGPLSARLTGTEYLVRVAPVDPVDPFRGAYVVLGYPDLGIPFPDGALRAGGGTAGSDLSGTVFVPLVRDGDLWVGAAPVASRPDGPAVRCRADHGALSCGIESYFLPQREARSVEEAIWAGQVTARITVSSSGSAAVVALIAGDRSF